MLNYYHTTTALPRQRRLDKRSKRKRWVIGVILLLSLALLVFYLNAALSPICTFGVPSTELTGTWASVSW